MGVVEDLSHSFHSRHSWDEWVSEARLLEINDTTMMKKAELDVIMKKKNK